MSDYCTKMALLDDTNGNTVNLNSHPGGEAAGEGCMVTTTAESAAMLQSPSNDDLSQSLSEYTDADESISAPTELLAEFLSAIMIRDYVNALKYCKQILQYEPNNTTARDFYPHILSKINENQSNELSGESDENYNFNYSSPLASSGSSPTSSSAPSRSSRASASSSSSSGCDDIDEVIMVCSSDSDDSSEACHSFPESIDDEPGGESGTRQVPVASGRLGPVRSSHSGRNPLAPAGSRSLSDSNTSQSYSSLLLEDEEKDLTLSDISNLNIEEDETSNDCGGSLGSSSSPLDPVGKPALLVPAVVAKPVASTNLGSASVFASKLVAMLRSKVIPSKGAGD
ncbi:uncharacterized protein LOC128729133 [Anopheles nili]|uniref:uncharacterized protein LOC128729133 n=1 Tax=Anopheles nili TaxID=185578 RepID=UPI00237AEC0B|nr:uncharacterized protein LOC128729133 [Anopheles nili]